MINDMMYGYPNQVSNRAWNGLFDWTQNNRVTDIPNYITASTDMMRGLSYITRDITPKVSLIAFGTISDYSNGGVLHPNGLIYMIPNAGQITVFNPYNETFTTFGSLGATVNKYGGGCLGLDTNIYCSPWLIGDSAVLKINPYSKTSQITNPLTSGYYGNIILGQNGLLYCGSWDTIGGQLAVVNPYTEEIIKQISAPTTFGSDTRFGFGTLAPNGLIYYAPNGSDSFLVLDPYSNTVKAFACVSSGASVNRYAGIVLAPNGKLYCIPQDSDYVMEIDPSTNKTRLFGAAVGAAATQKWYGGALAPDGCIYGIPFTATSILKINPITEEVTTFGTIAGSGKFRGAIMHPNGCMYGITSSGDAILKLDFGVSTSSTATLCREYNKL